MDGSLVCCACALKFSSASRRSFSRFGLGLGSGCWRLNSSIWGRDLDGRVTLRIASWNSYQPWIYAWAHEYIGLTAFPASCSLYAHKEERLKVSALGILRLSRSLWYVSVSSLWDGDRCLAREFKSKFTRHSLTRWSSQNIQIELGHYESTFKGFMIHTRIQMQNCVFWRYLGILREVTWALTSVSNWLLLWKLFHPQTSLLLQPTFPTNLHSFLLHWRVSTNPSSNQPFLQPFFSNQRLQSWTSKLQLP